MCGKAELCVGMPLPGAAVTQTVYPSIFFMYTTGTLSPSTACKSVGWGGAVQAAFAKCMSQSLLVPPAFALHVVMSSPLHHLVFQRLLHNKECRTSSENHALSVLGME